MAYPASEPAAPAADYDTFAVAYAASNENNLFNAYYARPEMLRLARTCSYSNGSTRSSYWF